MTAFTDTSIHFAAFYDGDITDDARDAMGRVETELIAFFPETHIISHSVQRCDYPKPIPKNNIWVYCRQEQPDDE